MVIKQNKGHSLWRREWELSLCVVGMICLSTFSASLEERWEALPSKLDDTVKIQDKKHNHQCMKLLMPFSPAVESGILLSRVEASLALRLHECAFEQAKGYNMSFAFFCSLMQS